MNPKSHRKTLLTRSRQRQHGLSIIEIMVAITVSLILLAGVVQILVSSKQTYQVQDVVGRLQENGRFAIDFITNETRAAGYMGCSNLWRTDPVIVTNPAVTFDSDNILQSYDNTGTSTWTPALPATITNAATAAGTAVMDGTDVLTVMRGATCSSFLANSMGSATADINLADNTCQIADDDVLIISDCRFAHVFTANDVNPDPTGSNQSTPVTVAHSKSGNKNNSDNLTLYTARAQVSKFENITYFIGTGASGEPALWQIRDGTARELVDGVEDLQIWFGQDGNGDFSADRYLKASDGAFDMGQAISMRMHLLLRTSSDNVTADPQQYIFDGATVTATDNRLRREFKTMVNLRNKSLWYPSP